MITVWVAVAGWTVSATAEEDKVRYQFQVFRLTGSFDRETSLEKEIWAGSPENWEEIKGEVALFDRGEFRIGSDRLRIGRHGCYWNDRKLTFEEGIREPLPEEKIKLIYSPNLMKRLGELVHLKIESRQPFEYMERGDDGLFRLKQLSLPVGMDIEIKAEREARNVFLLSYLELELRTVNHREEAVGTRLPVGRPILEEHEYRLRLKVREQKNYGILIRPRGARGGIIIRIEVDDE